MLTAVGATALGPNVLGVLSATSSRGTGRVLGVDSSDPMLERARQLAAAGGAGNVSCELVDAAVHPFELASFDVAISRFGMMFFADPELAFANIRRAIRL